jgi:hypothetical protein
MNEFVNFDDPNIASFEGHFEPELVNYFGDIASCHTCNH